MAYYLESTKKDEPSTQNGPGDTFSSLYWFARRILAPERS